MQRRIVIELDDDITGHVAEILAAAAEQAAVSDPWTYVMGETYFALIRPAGKSIGLVTVDDGWDAEV